MTEPDKGPFAKPTIAKTKLPFSGDSPSPALQKPVSPGPATPRPQAHHEQAAARRWSNFTRLAAFLSCAIIPLCLAVLLDWEHALAKLRSLSALYKGHYDKAASAPVFVISECARTGCVVTLWDLVRALAVGGGLGVSLVVAVAAVWCYAVARMVRWRVQRRPGASLQGRNGSALADYDVLVGNVVRRLCIYGVLWVKATSLLTACFVTVWLVSLLF